MNGLWNIGGCDSHWFDFAVLLGPDDIDHGNTPSAARTPFEMGASHLRPSPFSHFLLFQPSPLAAATQPMRVTQSTPAPSSRSLSTCVCFEVSACTVAQMKKNVPNVWEDHQLRLPTENHWPARTFRVERRWHREMSRFDAKMIANGCSAWQFLPVSTDPFFYFRLGFAHNSQVSWTREYCIFYTK